MRLLRRLADSGKTILLTVHQPSLEAYRLMDNLVLVSKDKGSSEPGQLVYYGPAHPNAAHFFNPNVASKPDPLPDDIFKGLSQRPSAEWAADYRRSNYYRQFVTARGGRPSQDALRKGTTRLRHYDVFRQWRTLTARCLTIKCKDLWNTLILAAQAPVVAILVVLVFVHKASLRLDGKSLTDWGNVGQAVGPTVFLVTLASLWFGCSNAAREIVGEWAIYHRERMINLLVPSYIASKLTVLGGLCVLQCAVLLGITHWGCSLKGPWLPMLLVLVLVSFVGVAIGLTLSVLCANVGGGDWAFADHFATHDHPGGSFATCGRTAESGSVVRNSIPVGLRGRALAGSRQAAPQPPRQAPRSAAGCASGHGRGGERHGQKYFPPKYRFGVRISMIVLLLLWFIAVVAVYVILRSRDVHRIGIRRRR